MSKSYAYFYVCMQVSRMPLGGSDLTADLILYKKNYSFSSPFSGTFYTELNVSSSLNLVGLWCILKI